MPLSVMTRESPFINVLERIRHTKGHQALVHKRTSLKRPNSDYTWCHFPLEKNRSGHLEKKNMATRMVLVPEDQKALAYRQKNQHLASSTFSFEPRCLGATCALQE